MAIYFILLRLKPYSQISDMIATVLILWLTKPPGGFKNAETSQADECWGRQKSAYILCNHTILGGLKKLSTYYQIIIRGWHILLKSLAKLSSLRGLEKN